MAGLYYFESRNVLNTGDSTVLVATDALDSEKETSGDRSPLSLCSTSVDSSRVPYMTLHVVAMSVLVAIGGFISGYDTGQISGFLEMEVFLKRFGEMTEDTSKHPTGYRFSNVRSGLIIGLLSIGSLVGCLIAGAATNRVGRRATIPPSCLIVIIGITFQVIIGQSQWVGIAIGRWIVGLGVGSLSVVVPLYIAETSPVPIRGSLISYYQLSVAIGMFTAVAINYRTAARTDTGSYRIPLGIGYIWTLILGVGIFFLPETPRYDFHRGRRDRGLATMSKFYGVKVTHPLIRHEAAQIERERKATTAVSFWYEVFTAPRMLYRLALGTTLQMFQQLTGANVLFYYGITVFQGVGIKNFYIAAMILAAVNMVTTCGGVHLALHSRRRETLYIGALWQSVCFLVYASIGQFVFKEAAEDSSLRRTCGIIMIVFTCLFSFATTWGPLIWAVNAEMYPYRFRGLSLGLATSSNWFWNFILVFFTPFIKNDIDFAYGYVFAGCNLAAAIVVYLFLVESSHRTLEEVDALYVLNIKPIGSHKYVFRDETKDSLDTNAGHVDEGPMLMGSKGLYVGKKSEAIQEGVVVVHDEGLPALKEKRETDG